MVTYLAFQALMLIATHVLWYDQAAVAISVDIWNTVRPPNTTDYESDESDESDYD